MGYAITDICNMALSRLGQRNISSLTDGSNEANFCSQFFNIARDAVLSEFPWNFAFSTMALALSTAYTDPRWLFCYGYPAPALAIRRVYNPQDEQTTMYALDWYGNFSLAMPMPPFYTDNARGPKYRIVSDGNYRYILSNIATASADITISIADPNLFSMTFIMALVCRLAWEIAMPVSGSIGRKEEAWKDYQTLMYGSYLQNTAEDNNPPRLQRRYSNARR